MRTFPDPFARRWSRRSFTWSMVVLATVLMVVASPVWLVVCGAIDLVFRGRVASVRGTLFVLTYLSSEIVGLSVSFWAWLRYRAMPGSSDADFRAGMYRAQFRWAKYLAFTSTRVLGLRIHVESDYDFGEGRRVILVARHTSIADTLAPMVYVCVPHNLRLGFVMKRELEWDPSLDLAVSRLSHIFVIRGSGKADKEIEAIGRMIEDDTADGVVIFPEGTRYTPQKRERVLRALEESGEEDLRDWAREHRKVLPPRMGGLLALLERNRDADVVFCAHRGFEHATSFREVFNGSLIGADIHIKLWGVPYEEIPETEAERRAWLLEHWSRVDEFAGTP